MVFVFFESELIQKVFNGINIQLTGRISWNVIPDSMLCPGLFTSSLCLLPSPGSQHKKTSSRTKLSGGRVEELDYLVSRDFHDLENDLLSRQTSSVCLQNISSFM